MIEIGILTASDRAHAGIYADAGGPRVESILRECLADDWQAVFRIVPDEDVAITTALEELCDRCCCVITTGGTGPAPRDITPDVVERFADRVFPGFGEKMRASAWDRIPTAILSRQIGASRGRCLILCLPGNPKAIAECLDAVLAAVPHCIELLGGPKLNMKTGYAADH